MQVGISKQALAARLGDIVDVDITRSSIEHRWAIAIGSHLIPLPWADTADCVGVVLWLRENFEGIKVHVLL